MHLAVVLDCASPDALAEFWRAALNFTVIHRDATYVALRAEDGSRPTLVLQRVPEPKATKNRMHLDVHTDNYEDDLTRLRELGAREIHPEQHEAGTRWVVLADPEGNEFCVLTRTSRDP